MNKTNNKLIINIVLLLISIIIVLILGIFQKNLLGYIILILLNIYVFISSIAMIKTEKKIS